MKIPFKLGDKTFYLNQYTTFQEKEILLLDGFDIHTCEAVFDILNFSDYKDLSQAEKKIILFKFREISLGDDVQIQFICEKCKLHNDSILEASDFIKPAIRNDSDIKKIIRNVTDYNLHEYCDIDIDDLDIKEYEELKQRIKDNQLQVNFIKTTKCIKCQTEKNFDLSSMKYIIEIMSDDNLMSLYKSYNNLVFFGKYSKLDIDSMYPFERTILIGLLNKTQEDLTNK